MKSLISARKRKTRGIALPVAIALIVVLITLALAIIIQSRSTGSMQQSSEKKMEKSGTAELIGGKLQSVFSETNPSPQKLSEIGLNSLPPSAGGEVVTFGGKTGNVEFSGSFNGGDNPWSVYQPIPSTIDPKTFTSEGPKVKSYDAANLPVPPNHSQIFVNVKTPEGKTTTYYYNFSNNSPYGVIAPKGSIRLKEAVAVSKPGITTAATDENKATGDKFYLFSNSSIEVDGNMNGIARISAKNGSGGTVKIGDGSQGEIRDEEPPPPDPELIELMKQIEKVMSRMEGNSEEPGFMEIAMAISAASILFQGFEMIDLAGFEFDGDHMIWNNSLIVPKNMCIMIPFEIEIAGDLILMEGSAVVVGGDLEIAGHLFLDEESAVMAQGNLTVNERTEVTYSIDNIGGINASVMAQGNIVLNGGVRHCKFKPGSGSIDFGFQLLKCPFPKIEVDGVKIENPLCKVFRKLQAELFAPLKDIAGKMLMFLAGKISVPVGDEDMDMPGLLIASSEGGVRIVDEGKDAGLAGLIVCNNSIVLEFPPDGSGVFEGLLISLNGSIEAFNVKYRYYPYYSAAAAPVGKGDSEALVVLPEPHLVSSGEYQK